MVFAKSFIHLVIIFAFVGFSHISLAQGVSEIDPAAANYQSNPAKEFIMSCTYGVLAGTLVGAAILAFEDQPGDNLKKVARGASLGLYAGILLGLYVVYGVPSGAEEMNLDPYNQPGLPPLEDGRLYEPPKTQFRAGLLPAFDNESRIVGASAVMTWRVF